MRSSVKRHRRTQHAKRGNGSRHARKAPVRREDLWTAEDHRVRSMLSVTEMAPHHGMYAGEARHERDRKEPVSV